MIYGAIEAGGTKFVCITATGPDQILSEIRIPTTMPDETLARAVQFFKEHGPVDAVGIAAFGPLDLHPGSPQFGYITTTPKAGWSFVNIKGTIESTLKVKTSIDTDVNGAALSEATWGAGKGCGNVVYLTIGTGVGGGCVINGQPLHGLLHPEMGHMRLPHDHKIDPFEGICPFHKDCFEGLASGTALHARWGISAEDMDPEHPAWALEADYIALALNNIILTHSPQKIIMGGGVMQQAHLFPLIHQRVQTILNQYLHSPIILEKIAEYIVPPQLGNQSGVLGGLALAMQTH